ncbi:hypothetical protein PILCRDRAFT_14692 [Piloderma croceum F 1598]|uniref:Uncharacterized protein n=1 Tax=Piloderma croceum (strain F 1598) TaxID=765440 RepID=A0A0C3AJY2_PILCF|nr:hypothetical protein PILCRDRAFT_14692 [Piloderma croceum F 1598]
MYAILCVLVSLSLQHGQIKVNLINLGSFSNYKKLPTYKKSKQENKENEPLDPDTLPPSMKPEGKRQRIHQSLSYEKGADGKLAI